MKSSMRALSMVALPIVVARALNAQVPTVSEHALGTPCTYERCALSIAPRWNGLAVVRGAAGSRIANLNFFWPRTVTEALRGTDASALDADSAAAQARRALQLRRIGAALTDGGAVLAAVVAVGALRAGRFRANDKRLAGAAGAALMLSVSFQFAADGALSRAVWWHNRRFSAR